MGVRFLIQVAIAFVLTGVLSFYGVRHLLDQRKVDAVDAAAVAEAEYLRAHANELVQLTGLYFERLPRSALPPNDETRRWIAHSFRPRVNDLRQRLVHTRSHHPLVDSLIRGADRLAAMAARPDDARVRRLAADAVLEAHGAVEAWISSRGLRTSLSTPPVMPSFR